MHQMGGHPKILKELKDKSAKLLNVTHTLHTLHQYQRTGHWLIKRTLSGLAEWETTDEEAWQGKTTGIIIKNRIKGQLN